MISVILGIFGTIKILWLPLVIPASTAPKTVYNDGILIPKHSPLPQLTLSTSLPSSSNFSQLSRNNVGPQGTERSHHRRRQGKSLAFVALSFGFCRLDALTFLTLSRRR